MCTGQNSICSYRTAAPIGTGCRFAVAYCHDRKGCMVLKVWILKKHTLIFAAVVTALCVALAFFVIQLVPRGIAAAAAKKELPIYCVDRTEKIASLSFDAAWGAEDTPTLIRILNEHHVHATFFVVGQWVDKYPDAVKALSDAGNEVMNHSDTHPHMPSLSREAMQAQVSQCDQKIEKITGKKPTLFRPPYGDYNNTVIETLRGMDHDVIQWDVDSLDWKGISADAIQKRVLSKVRPGSIVLFHNAALHTPEALPGIIDSLQKDGYQLVPISQLIYHGAYTIDTQGRQHAVTSSTESSHAADAASTGLF